MVNALLLFEPCKGYFMHRFRIPAAATAVLALGLLGACDRNTAADRSSEGPAERVGESIDEGARNAERAAERAGERIERGADDAARATGRAADRAGEAIEEGAEDAARAAERAGERGRAGANESRDPVPGTPAR
jgi:hypothetical protein